MNAGAAQFRYFSGDVMMRLVCIWLPGGCRNCVMWGFVICTGDQVVEDGMGVSCNTNGSEGKCMQGLGGET